MPVVSFGGLLGLDSGEGDMTGVPVVKSASSISSKSLISSLELSVTGVRTAFLLTMPQSGVEFSRLSPPL